MTPARIQTPIVQFGTSRFLQAHADLFVDDAMREGQECGPIAVVQSTGDPGRAARLAALAAPEGYPVRIRGREGGAAIDRTRRVLSVRRTLSTATDWDAVVAVMRDEARFVLSNTGERGFDAGPADAAPAFDQAMSYPAKLTLLLRARFEAGGAPLTILPTELLVRNGDALKARVIALAGQGGAPGAFGDWLGEGVIWANSLVDRIVSEPIEPAGAVAEPYALWAIENAPGLVPPCTHPAIRMVDDLEPYAALKLFILNLGHTWLVSRWRRTAAAPRTVAALLDDAATLEALRDLYAGEVMPGFDAAGMGGEARAYAETTIERYRNPFLDHFLADIERNQEAKARHRIGGFVDWAAAKGDRTPKPRLTAALRQGDDA